MEGQSMAVMHLRPRTVGVGDGAVAEEHTFTEVADDRAIAADYAVAGRLLGRELAKRYADHLADPDNDDTLLDAHITVAAIGKTSARTVFAIVMLGNAIEACRR